MFKEKPSDWSIFPCARVLKRTLPRRYRRCFDREFPLKTCWLSVEICRHVFLFLREFSYFQFSPTQSLWNEKTPFIMSRKLSVLCHFPRDFVSLKMPFYFYSEFPSKTLPLRRQSPEIKIVVILRHQEKRDLFTFILLLLRPPVGTYSIIHFHVH